MLLLLMASAPCHLAYDPDVPGTVSLMIEPQLLISEFYPCGLSGDEYVAIANPGTFTTNLNNWSFSDGEGKVTFVGTVWLAPGSCHYTSWNSSSFSAAYGRSPDSWISGDSWDGNISVTGSFRLADNGDSIVLLSPSGVISDYVVYGVAGADGICWDGAPVPAIRQGEVARRIRSIDCLMDTNCSVDWFPFREYRYGYTEVRPSTYDLGPGSIVSFTSPDCGLDVVLEAIHSARSVIRLCTYEFSSSTICEALARAIELGVDVRLLVDGAPAGGMDDDEVRCLSALTGRGAQVQILNGNLTEDRVQHVGPLHAKYAVFDLSSVIVLSENFVESGLPTDRIFGNRGWGLWMRGSGPAGYLAALFDEDSRGARADVIDWRDDPRFDPWGTLPVPLVGDHLEGIMEPVRNEATARASFFVSPDCSPESPFIASMLESATSVLLEQFQADLAWTSRWTGEEVLNPIVAGAAAVVEAGGEVRALLDSCWFNVERNSQVMDYLNAISAAQQEGTVAKLMMDESPIGVLHNKGFIVNRNVTVVSSNNLVMSSFARNRELAVAVESPEVAAFFCSAFELDWCPDDESPVAEAGHDATITYGESIVLDSKASSDDRAIAWFYWDADGDGSVDGVGPTFDFRPTEPGVFLVELVVVDAWGNRDTDIVSIRVRTVDDALVPGMVDGHPGGFLVLATVGALGTAVGVLLARKRRGSRKLNQQRAD